MKKGRQVFIVSKNMGGIIKKAVPDCFDTYICKNYEEANDEYVKFSNPNEKHLVILDNREEDELLDLSVSLKNANKNIRIIFMFSLLHEKTAYKAVNLGIEHIFTKPFFDGDLTEKIVEVLNGN